MPYPLLNSFFEWTVTELYEIKWDDTNELLTIVTCFISNIPVFGSQ